MIDEGEQAPSFTLPAVRDGEIEAVSLEEYLSETVVILAFYPGDFNPACTSHSTGLDDLDLFTMQKDVTILALSGDSVYSHRAFAEEYDLHIPLLADVTGDVAATYGVAVDEEAAGHLTRRAVVVIDHSETVEYTWLADDVTDLPDIETLRDVIEGLGSDETAQARYRVGHAHYMEGRRAFTSAMSAYEEKDWMLSRRDFEQAKTEFGEAKEEFNTAVRFAQDEDARAYYDRAERKSEALWRAADWLSESADAYASGEGAKAMDLREDSEAPLDEARRLGEPIDPDELPPDGPPEPLEADEPETFLLEEEPETDTSLDLDSTAMEQSAEKQRDDEFVETARAAESGEESAADATGEGDTSTGPTAGGGKNSSTDSGERATPGQDSKDSDATDEQDGDEMIDDDELEEIAAELEEQTEAAQQRYESEREDEDDDHGEGMDAENVEDGLDEDDLELELTDPTEGEDDDRDEDDRDEDDSPSDDDLGSGNHGVPDSL